MIKAASLPVGLMFLLATAPAAWSQAPADETAINEAIYRQANRVTLRKKLVEARAAQERHAPVAAAKLYDEAWDLVQKIGSGVEAEREGTVAGLAAVRLELARAAQRRDDLKEAEVQIKDVLRVDPSNAAAIEFKRGNEKLLVEQRGTIPSPETQAQVSGALEEKVQANTLVHDGKLLYELGKMNEAEKKLKLALQESPRNQAALYYLSLVSEAKYTQAIKEHGVTVQQNLSEVEQAWASKPMDQAWSKPIARELLPVPNPYARTNLIHTSPGRQTIVSKLDRLRLPTLKYEGLPLGEVIINLNDEARKIDPEKRGINFIVSQNVDSGGSPALAAFTLGPDGQPLPSAAPEPTDIGAIQIKINPALTDVRLADALDAIVSVADKPIKYSILDYAIVFSLKGHEPTPLYVRNFKVDPNTFYQGLQSVGAFVFGESQNVGQNNQSGGFGGSQGGGGGGSQGQSQNTISGAIISRVSAAPGGVTGGRSGQGQQQTTGGGGGLSFITKTNNMEDVSAAARNYFQTLGVDLDPQRNPGKALFFNDRQGVLIVRATMQDLDMIEAAIQTLNIVPAQVNIKAKFIEVEQDDTKSLGFDWYLGNVSMNNGTIFGQGGSAASLSGANSPYTVFPGSASAGTTIASSATDQLLTSGLRTSGSSLFTLTGILTDPQFRMVLHALEQRQGIELLAQPEVTTQSGRQAQMKATDIKTVITGFSFSSNNQGTTGGGGGGGGGGNNNVIVNQATIVYPLPEQMETGPVLDVIPCVLSDGFTVNLTVIPTLAEFTGYDDPSSVLSSGVLSSAGTIGGFVVVPTVLPKYTVRQVASAVNVWDGQTVVLGGLISENVKTIKDKVPMLGDLPLLGRFFRSESKDTSKKNLLIFITPTLIDPAGNRLHSEDEMPFASAAYPVQPAAAAGQANK